MNLSNSYTLLLGVSLCVMLLQLTVKNKQLVHILFAIFCGSMAMYAAQKLSVESLSHYHYLVGMGACATCNVSWLLARALFRNENAITRYHIALATLVAVLLVTRQGLSFYVATMPFASSVIEPVKLFIQEFVILLSSTLIVMSFWEGCRGWSHASRIDKQQRMVFLTAFGAAVTGVLLVAQALPKNVFGPDIRAWVACYAALFMILISQFLIRWRVITETYEANRLLAEQEANESAKTASNVTEDKQLVSDIGQLLYTDKSYLQTNLKVADIAHRLGVSEYRVSRVLKYHFSAENFNHFVNTLRIEHAKTLLADEEKAHWSVLVIGIESGFASVGPFTRAFKKTIGCTPGQYRKHCLKSDQPLPT
ncbi:AraC family transcriptional regulator [Alteromonadaceae bacterium M269]|nr:AraC family transcriptional regulator [Alteromonadaceae bacterium M269]